MKYRNAKRLANGWIDCEIEYENHGWIPFTCDPNDTGALFDTSALHAAMNADPKTQDYVPEPPQPEPEPEPVVEIDPVPASLSFAQFMIGLVAEQWITEEDGRLWLTGTLPPQVISTISLIPAEHRFAATAKATRPLVVNRSDALVQMMALAQKRSDEELDDFFRTYASV